MTDESTIVWYDGGPDEPMQDAKLQDSYYGPFETIQFGRKRMVGTVIWWFDLESPDAEE